MQTDVNVTEALSQFGEDNVKPVKGGAKVTVGGLSNGDIKKLIPLLDKAWVHIKRSGTKITIIATERNS